MGGLLIWLDSPYSQIRPPNSSRSLWRLGGVTRGRVGVSNMSSENKEILNPCPLTNTPLMLGSCRIWAPRGSTPREQRAGESGHPCPVPFEMVKGGDASKGVFNRGGRRCIQMSDLP